MTKIHASTNDYYYHHYYHHYFITYYSNRFIKEKEKIHDVIIGTTLIMHRSRYHQYYVLSTTITCSRLAVNPCWCVK